MEHHEVEQDQGLSKEWRYTYGHPQDLIIGDPSHGIKTHSFLRNIDNYLAFVSQIELKIIEEAENDPN